MIIKLSIITPVLNGEKFIEFCMQNVIQQNCPNVEHLILDACSTDGTCSAIINYGKTYPHIRWISEKDEGQSDAMNKGIAMAKGDVVGFLNVDDFYEPNLLNRIVKLYESAPNPSLFVGNCNVIDVNGQLLSVNRPVKLKLAQLLAGPAINPWPINPSAYFYHRSLHDKIGPYKIDEHYALDVDFLLRAVQVANVQYFDETWGNFRLIEGTKTYNDQEIEKNVTRYKSILKLYKKDLPWFIRRIFLVYKSWQKLKHWAGYVKDPSLFMTVLKNKINRFLGKG